MRRFINPFTTILTAVSHDESTGVPRDVAALLCWTGHELDEFVETLPPTDETSHTSLGEALDVAHTLLLATAALRDTPEHRQALEEWVTRQTARGNEYTAQLLRSFLLYLWWHPRGQTRLRDVTSVAVSRFIRGVSRGRDDR